MCRLAVRGRYVSPITLSEAGRFTIYREHMVPGEGIEPSLCRQNWILSPARLPIPPSRPDCIADVATASPCDHADYRSNATVLQTP